MTALTATQIADQLVSRPIAVRPEEVTELLTVKVLPGFGATVAAAAVIN
ncbi:hypothetical protein ACFCZ1_12435 [Streptomyces sp. NPDC056224]